MERGETGSGALMLPGRGVPGSARQVRRRVHTLSLDLDEKGDAEEGSRDCGEDAAAAGTAGWTGTQEDGYRGRGRHAEAAREAERHRGRNSRPP